MSVSAAGANRGRLSKNRRVGAQRRCWSVRRRRELFGERTTTNDRRRRSHQRWNSICRARLARVASTSCARPRLCVARRRTSATSPRPALARPVSARPTRACACACVIVRAAACPSDSLAPLNTPVRATLDFSFLASSSTAHSVLRRRHVHEQRYAALCRFLICDLRRRSLEDVCNGAGVCAGTWTCQWLVACASSAPSVLTGAPSTTAWSMPTATTVIRARSTSARAARAATNL